MTATQDRLLLVFVHGFRGTDTTFKATNEQTGIGVEICCIDTSACRISQNDSRPLQQVLTSIRLFILATRHQGTTFISFYGMILMTDRDFNVAVHNLQVWLQDQVKQQQAMMASSGQAGNVLIVFLGHSMGGIVCKYLHHKKGS